MVNVRHMLIDGGSEQNPLSDSVTDLRGKTVTKESMDLFEERLREAEAFGFNTSQMDVLRTVSKIDSNILAVMGPPGTGKTRVFARVVWILVELGFNVVICSSSNTGVDNFLLEVIAQWPQHLRDKMILRSETETTEKTSIIYESLTGDVDMDRTMDRAPKTDVEDDPRVQLADDTLVAEYTLEDPKWAEFHAEVEKYHENWAQVQDFKNFDTKTINVPYGTTLAGRIFMKMKADAAKAAAEERADQQAHPTGAVQPADERNPSAAYKTFWKTISSKVDGSHLSQWKSFAQSKPRLKTRDSRNQRAFHDYDQRWRSEFQGCWVRP